MATATTKVTILQWQVGNRNNHHVKEAIYLSISIALLPALS
jgi:hypothetical protein